MKITVQYWEQHSELYICENERPKDGDHVLEVPEEFVEKFRKVDIAWASMQEVLTDMRKLLDTKKKLDDYLEESEIKVTGMREDIKELEEKVNRGLGIAVPL